MRIETFRVGDVVCKVLVHGRGRGTPGWMFPGLSSDLVIARMRPYLDERGEFEFVYSSLLLQSGTENVLIDTGLPTDPDGDRPSIDRALAAAGVGALDIGAVVVSHGHLDHVGGLTTNGRPAFPRARHYVHVDELAFWTTGDEANGSTAAILRPVVDAGLLQAVDGEQDILAGIRLLPTPGHTPGHLSVAIRSGHDHALYVGDALAHEVNVPEPGWNHFSDMFGQAAAHSRRRLVERAARDDAIIVGAHMATRGRAVPRGHGRLDYVPAPSRPQPARPRERT